MKHRILFSALLFLAFSSYGAPSLQGSWFSEEDGLTLNFVGDDSLFVTSTIEESMAGMGVYTASDSTISATVVNEDITIEMGYNYRWQDSNTIEAQPLFFTINGEAIEVPSEWTTIVRQEQQEHTEE